MRPVLLVTGASGNLPADGLTVASENLVYVQGNYNASNNPLAILEPALLPPGTPMFRDANLTFRQILRPNQ